MTWVRGVHSLTSFRIHKWTSVLKTRVYRGLPVLPGSGISHFGRTPRERMPMLEVVSCATESLNLYFADVGITTFRVTQLRQPYNPFFCFNWRTIFHRILQTESLKSARI